MKKRLIAGTMALALMAGQFGMAAFADSKDNKQIAKPIVVKAQMVKKTNGKSQYKAVPLTEKELEELMKQTNGLKLNAMSTMIVGNAFKDAAGNIVQVDLVSGVEVMPATMTVPATKIEEAPKK